jgi:hypothetical protein
MDARRMSTNDATLSSNNFLNVVFDKHDLHIAMFNRQSELTYLKRLVHDLMPLLLPKSIYECKGARHFLRELFVCQIILDGIDIICRPDTLNRLFHLFFTTAIRHRHAAEQPHCRSPSMSSVELLAHFSVMNGPLHRNQLALELADVMYEKELMNQFSRVLDRHGSIGLLSIYITLSDVLNDIPSASNVLVRNKIYQRLKSIDERHLNSNCVDNFVRIRGTTHRFVDDFKRFIYDYLERCLDDESIEQNMFDIQKTFTILSRFHCQIYELVEYKYKRYFLNSDEHFLYMCGPRMDSPDYRMIEQR